MGVRVVSMYDLDEGARSFLQRAHRSARTIVITADRRPRLVLMPYERYRILAEQLAEMSGILRELTETVVEAESQHPYQELKEDLIAEGVLDRD